MARKLPRLNRALDAPALASVAYGEIASSIYFALGVIALHALGFTPLLLGIVGLLFLIVALSIQRDTGGNLAETLANLSALLRARQQLRLKIRAFTSEARTTMLIMTGLPFLVGGVLFLITPSYITPLVSTSTGQMVAAAAACKP